MRSPGRQQRAPFRACARIAAAVLLVAFRAGSPSPAADYTVVNPHDTGRPDFCLDCHSPDVYDRDCDDPAGFCLLADSVDGLCLLCHVKEQCCPTGRAHQSRLFLGIMSHPSDIDLSDVEEEYAPSTLPVQDGRITCRTCHLHTRRPENDYKMLRIVTVRGEEVDWSGLCTDCHKEGY